MKWVTRELPLPGSPDLVMYGRSIETEEGAHTIGWDPSTRRLFAVLAQSCGVAIHEDAA